MASGYKMWQISCFLFFLCSLVLARSKDELIQLSEDTWTDMLQGEWLVKFYAPWCPACKALTPVWEDVATWSDDLDIKVAEVDVTENPGLSGRFLVTSLPSIYHVKNGVFRMYRGPRAENDLISFVDDKKWEEVEPVPWYTSPTSVHMGALGMFFKVSMSIRDLHDKMTTDYNIPVWGSYTIFAVATIILGLLIGLLIVFMCDVMLPGHPPEKSYLNTHQQYPPGIDPRYRNVQDRDDDRDSDIIEDDLPARNFRPQPSEPTPSPQDGASQQPLSKESSKQSGDRSQGEESEEEGGSQNEEGGSQDEGSQGNASQEDLSQDEEETVAGQGVPEGEEAQGGDLKRPDRPKSARRRPAKVTTD